MDRVPSFDAIEYLVRRKFLRSRGSLPRLHPRCPSQVVGDCELLNESESAAAYRAELAQKAPAEIHELVCAEEKKEQDELEEDRFFNQPSARADFDHWCKAASWTLDECVALSLGKDPKRVSWGRVQPLVQLSPFAKSYEKLRDLTLRAMSAKQLSDPVSPGTYLAWARRHGIGLPDELINRAVNGGISLEDWQDLFERHKAHTDELLRQHEEANEQLRAALEAERAANSTAPRTETPFTACDKPLGTRERENLQLIALVGAIRGYGFDPDKRNSAATAIERDLDDLARRVSDDTIRDHLRAAAEMLLPDWRKRLRRKPNSDIG
jgi:hypothetical protein